MSVLNLPFAYGTLLCVCCISAVLIGHVRARQLSTHVSSSPHCARLNKASFCMGLLSAVGMTVAANYPVCPSTYMTT